MKPLKLIASLAFCALFFGCADKGKPTTVEKKISTAAPQKVTAKEQAVPQKELATPSEAPAKELPKGHPPTGTKTASPTSRPNASRPTSQPSQTKLVAPGIIKGRVEIAESLRDRVKSGTTLFISVRRYSGEGQRGMIMAAKKLPVGGPALFPLDFSVSQRDVMMGGTKLNGPVTVSARIDQDGDAISKQPGDIEGEHKGHIVVGQGRASIVLDVLRQ